MVALIDRTNSLNLIKYLGKYILENKLVFWLSIILLIISTLLITAKFYFNIKDEGVLINIATEIIGIVITVFVVNYIIVENDKNKWKTVEKRIINRIQRLVNEIIALQTLSFSLEVLRKPKENYINKDGNNIFILYAENKLLPRIEELISNINGETLDSFVFYLNEIEASVQKIFYEFCGKLPPVLFTKIYDLKEVLFDLIDAHRINTKLHFINSTEFLELCRSGDNFHNGNDIKFIITHTQTMIKIVIEIDKYLRDNYDYIEEKFPYKLDYVKSE